MSAFRDLEHTGWNAAVDDYADAFTRLTSQSIAPLLDALKAGPGVKLLDVACGPGELTAAARDRGATATGLDFSAQMLAMARRLRPDLTFIEGDAEALALPDASFDAVAMSFGILHLDQPQKAIHEAARVLKPGGRFAFTVWAPPEQTAAFRIVLGAVARCGKADVPLPPGPPFFQYSDAAVARSALEAAGFGDVTTTLVPQAWRFTQPRQLFDAMLSGTVRTAALLKAQTPEALAKVAEAIAAEVAGFRDGEGYALPMPSVLTCGRKRG